MDEPEQHTKPLRKIITAGEVVALLVCIAVILLASLFVLNKIKLHRDKATSLALSYQVVQAIHDQNGTTAHKLASPAYQHTYSAAKLTAQFKTLHDVSRKSPSLIYTGVTGTSGGRNVYFIYKYDTLKVPFYIRITVQHQGSHYYLVDITGSPDTSTLI